MSESLLVQRHEGVVIVTLNRPERLNALSADLMDALNALWDALAGDPGVRAVVLTGAGRGFCAGADAEFLSSNRTQRAPGVRGELNFLPGAVVDFPVIVAVNGVCAGGGLHFVADADIVIAATDAVFMDPHVSVGQVSGIEPASLALRLPVGIIARLALLGAAERMSAQRAYELGMVSELVDPGQLLPRAQELAETVGSASAESVRRTRRALRRVTDGLLESYLEAGWDEVRSHWSHPDASEGPRAFAEKRPPRWSDPLR